MGQHQMHSVNSLQHTYTYIHINIKTYIREYKILNKHIYKYMWKMETHKIWLILIYREWNR